MHSVLRAARWHHPLRKIDSGSCTVSSPLCRRLSLIWLFNNLALSQWLITRNCVTNVNRYSPLWRPNLDSMADIQTQTSIGRRHKSITTTLRLKLSSPRLKMAVLSASLSGTLCHIIRIGAVFPRHLAALITLLLLRLWTTSSLPSDFGSQVDQGGEDQ
jgi:hypothetical protein